MAEPLPRDVNRRIGRAMHTYDMLADGDRVLIAVSGGVDSLFLAWLLHYWLRKAPISYVLHGVHIDMAPDQDGPGAAALEVRRRLKGVPMALDIVPALWRPESSEPARQSQDICYTCARHRRKQLFDHAARLDMNKIALGHHRDDIIETFFLNICFAGNISTMVPRQELFSGSLALIRPLAFLDKEEIEQIAGSLGLEPVRNPCPLGEQTKRREVRLLLADLYRTIPQARQRIFASLSNVRTDYLLKPAGRKPGCRKN